MKLPNRIWLNANHGGCSDTRVEPDDVEYVRAAPTPEWVAVSERLPTREDADERWSVWVSDGHFVSTTELRFMHMDKRITHWQAKPRATPPEPPR